MHQNLQTAVVFPDAEESLIRLDRAGWSVSCTRFKGGDGPVWIVCGYNGENVICVHSAGRDEAWWRACEAAQAVGMLGRPPLPSPYGRSSLRQ